MKILMITPYLPYPLHSGGQIRTFNLLKQLSNKHQIHLISFIRERGEEVYLDVLKQYTSQVYIIKRRWAWDVRNILLSGFTYYPFLVSIYYSPFLKKLVKQLIKEHRFDVIHAETFYVLPNIPKTNIPILLVEQTIEYLVYKRFSQTISVPFIKPLLYLDVAKISYWEKRYWNQLTKLATVSEQDRKFISRITGRADIEVVPNGIDFNLFNQVYQHNMNRKRGKNVLFLGNFKWLPNKEAVLTLTRSIWPLIHKKLPSARLFIVGRNPTQQILSLHRPDLNIEVIGEVDDVRTIFANIDLLLVPILNGRGTKYKVLESIAAGIPIVGTRLAIEGLHLTPGRDVLISQDMNQLADYAYQVLSQSDLSRQLSQRAITKLKRHLSWPKVAAKLDTIYHQTKKPSQ